MEKYLVKKENPAPTVYIQFPRYNKCIDALRKLHWHIKVIRELARRTALHARNIIFCLKLQLQHIYNLKWVLLRKRWVIRMCSLKATQGFKELNTSRDVIRDHVACALWWLKIVFGLYWKIIGTQDGDKY